MSSASNRAWVDTSLRLLLPVATERHAILAQFFDVDLDSLVAFARKNVILLRLFRHLQADGLAPVSRVDSVMDAEEERIRRALELIEMLGEICSRAGIAFVFPKAFQHLPDMGHDVDLLITDPSPKIDRLIRDSIGASPGSTSLLNLFAGKTSHRVWGYPIPLEIHHGRIGRIGEHGVFARRLVENRGKVAVAGITTFVATREDQLLLQAVQRVFDHLSIRISDILQTVKLIQTSLNWAYVLETASEIGVSDELGYYLSYINSLLRALGSELCLPAAVAGFLPNSDQTGRLDTKNGVFQVPAWPTVRRLYIRRLVHEVHKRNWKTAGRLCLLSPAAVLLSVRTGKPRSWQ